MVFPARGFDGMTFLHILKVEGVEQYLERGSFNTFK